MFQQRQQLAETRKAERRTANKLKVFFLCQETARTEDEIIRHFRGMTPGESLDETEIRKTVYEMLSDQTLRFRSNGTFKARRNKALDDELES
jgi:hypothetical protein